VSSGSLVPGNDKTLLFTNAGMVQFKDLFTGDEVREYKRATTSQRCVRAGGKHNDLDNVGYTARHHTFFEMLGNFSFGDYFKEDAIRYAWQFLTAELGLPAEKLWITVFEEDDEAEDIWINQIGIPKERVIRIGAKDNFWMMGDTGPCGPCSEIFYDHGEDVWGGPPGSPEEDGDRFIEIWNLVFMQFDRSADGTMTPLPKPCVDTGMGLERTAAVLQHVHSNYEIDLFKNLIQAVVKLTGTNDLENPSLNVIADHIRSCAFLITDGVLPSNEGRGYVLRRIIRRAVRHGHKLGAENLFFHKLTAATLSAGLKIFDEEVATLSTKEIPGAVVFKLYDTYGFPVDLTADIARERGLEVDQSGFEEHMEAQRMRARAASNFGVSGGELPGSDLKTHFLGYDELHASATVAELYADGAAVDQIQQGQNAWVVLDQTPFYGESGGQVGDTGLLTADSLRFTVIDTKKSRSAFMHAGVLESGSLSVGDTVHAEVDSQRRSQIRRHHSATHLLHGALREVLGTHVEQKGSLVNEQHLRFDFSHTGPVSPEQIVQVEQWIDKEVRRNSPCVTEQMSMDEAVAAGAIALFGEKYGAQVRVVTLGDQSIELCGGTHVGATGELGAVKVTAETGVAAGVRRIEAVSGEVALLHNQQLDYQLSSIAAILKTSPSEVLPKLQQMQERQRELGRQVEQLQSKLSAQAGSSLSDTAETLNGVTAGDSAIVLASEHKGKAVLVSSVSKSLHTQLNAGDLMKVVAQALGGRGGGRADMAQGGADSTTLLCKYGVLYLNIAFTLAIH